MSCLPIASRWKVWKRLVERPLLDAADPLGADLPLPLAVALDQPLLLDQLDDVGLVVVVELVEVAEDLVAVVEHVLGELVEGLLGRLRLELLRAVPAGVFEECHEGPCPWAATSRGCLPLVGRGAGLDRLVQLVVDVQPFEDELGRAGGGGLAGLGVVAVG